MLVARVKMQLILNQVYWPLWKPGGGGSGGNGSSDLPWPLVQALQSQLDDVSRATRGISEQVQIDGTCLIAE